MSSQQNSTTNKSKEEDEIWNSLFGSTTDDKSQSQKREGRTTLMRSKDKKRHASKSSKTSKSSKSSRTSSSNSSNRNRHRSNSSNSSNGNRHNTNNNSSNSNNNNYGQQGPTTAERLSQFLCTPKTRARLPPPPLECKFLKYPHKKDRFTKFCATNLELNYKWEMHHDSLFPLPLDLMDPDYYNPLKQQYEYDINEEPLNRKEDERILQLLEEREYEKNAQEEQLMPEQEAFLLQTQYLTGGQEYELTESQRKDYGDINRITNDNNNRDRNNNNKKRKNRDWENDNINDLNNDNNNNQYNYIKKNNPHSLDNVTNTFIDIQDIKTHPTRNVKVDEMFDVFPHEGLLDNNYTHVQFDKDPIYHTRKCQFISKHDGNQRMKMAKLATQNTLLRCVNRKGLENESNNDNDIDDIDIDNDIDNKKEHDWFSLYATNGTRKKSEYDDEDIVKYEWAAEFVPVQMDKKKKMFFMVIPKRGIKGDDDERDDVYYANFNNRLNVRHKQTDTSQDNKSQKKGLSEQDKKFFKQQPMNIKLNVPRINESQEY